VVGVDEVVGVVDDATVVVEPDDEGLLLLPQAATPTAMSVAAARIANLRTVVLPGSDGRDNTHVTCLRHVDDEAGGL
jgi:hypothetical protein